MIERSNAGDNIQRPISSPESNMSVGGYNKGQSNNEAPPLPPHGNAKSNNNMHNGNIPQGIFNTTYNVIKIYCVYIIRHL